MLHNDDWLMSSCRRTTCPKQAFLLVFSQEEYERDKAAVDAVVARLAREDAEEAEAARRRRAAEHREMDAQRAAHAEAQRLQAAWERAEEER